MGTRPEGHFEDASGLCWLASYTEFCRPELSV
jgi:hypothetical protein